jgi:hypothetical protein
MPSAVEHSTLSTFLVVLAVLSVALAGHGTLMAAGEEALMRDVAAIAAASPLVGETCDSFLEPEETEPEPPRCVPTRGILPGSTADLAMQRAVQFLMEGGCVDEATRVLGLMARCDVHVGEVPMDRGGIAVPEQLVNLTAEEEKNPDIGFERRVALARTLVFAVNRLARDQGPARGPQPDVVAAWTRTLEVMSSWVRAQTQNLGSEASSPAGLAASQRALAVVMEMRGTLRDYRALSWCNDGRGEAWESLYVSLGKTRDLLRRRLEVDEETAD